MKTKLLLIAICLLCTAVARAEKWEYGVLILEFKKTDEFTMTIGWHWDSKTKSVNETGHVNVFIKSLVKEGIVKEEKNPTYNHSALRVMNLLGNERWELILMESNAKTDVVQYYFKRKSK